MNGGRDTSRPEAGTVVQRRGVAFWSIWIVPLAALALAAYWLYRSTVGSGSSIVIHFADGAGLRPDQSALKYRGVQAGLVKEVSYGNGGGSVDVVVQLNRGAEFLARQGSVFWIVTPEVTTSGVSGLGAIVSGSYIEALAGTGSRQISEFQGLAERPETDYGGLDLTLVTGSIDNLREGGAVKYRGLKVGDVTGIGLAEKGDKVLVKIHIDSTYRDLIRTNTKFWTPSGFEFSFSLFGESRFKAPSLSAAISGAVALYTPEDDTSEPAEPDMRFRLYSEPEDDWVEDLHLPEVAGRVSATDE